MQVSAASLACRSAEHHRKAILLVEDDEAFSQSAAAILRDAGYAVLTAPDFRNALTILEDRQRVDLFLTDIRLPTGTPHGFALARMARVRRPELRVLYITGIRDLPQGEINAACGKILRKPIAPATLVSEIGLALGDR